MNAPYRLTPTQASRKQAAMAFIREALATRGSPSYGEIAAALDIDRDRARDIVRSLVREGRIVRAPGAQRGISLPDHQVSVADAIAALRAQGWAVDQDAERLGELPVTIPTNPPLPVLPALAHFREAGSEDADAGPGGAAAGRVAEAPPRARGRRTRAADARA